ncbi:MAG TPA: hypothetical protein VFP39_09815 [Gemmatimonadales bacterium]|nr:hypothetical protein [Gemmatimonadales bacterium]
MSDPIARLPARPSLEQLRKQAKDSSHASGIPLHQAQLDLARRYGFESWPKLLHSVEAADPSNRLAQLERLADDLVSVAQSQDADAERRVFDLIGRTYPHPDRRTQLQHYLAALRGAEHRVEDLTLADARLIVARKFGCETWSELAGVAGSPSIGRSSPSDASRLSPFYTIDPVEPRVTVRPPLSEHDWDDVFDLMRELRLTDLETSGQLTDAGLARLARRARVTRLNLGDGRRLTDDGLQALAELDGLEELELGGPSCKITDRGLEPLRQLTSLRRLELSWAPRISDAGVTHLRGCDRLENVGLMGTPTGDGAIAALAGKERLRRLRTGKQVTDAGLGLLRQIPIFASWHGGEGELEMMTFDTGPNHLIVDGTFSDGGIATLATLHGVFGLSFFWHTSGFHAAALSALRAMPHLAFLGLQGPLCTDAAMQEIGMLPRLRMLQAQDTVAGDEGFAALSRSRSLEYLWGRDSKHLGSRGFAALAKMPSLRGLAVSCQQVSDDALSLLPMFPALRELTPMDVTDAAFRHVGRCAALERLWLMYCRETGDVATTHLEGLGALQTYYAGATKITDRSLEILGRMRSLERLEFYQCLGLTNAGLASLAQLPRLRAIEVGGSPNVTRAGMAVFAPGIRTRYWF